MSILKVKNLSFSYEEKQVLNDVSINLSEGEISLLIGSNGCGKSTLLHNILGHLTPSSGAIEIEDVDIATLKDKDIARKIAYVPQVHSRSFPYTVEQIVLMGRTASLDGFSGPKKADYEITHDALEKAGVIHLKDRIYTQISGGELQLVVLARALAQSTPIVLLDEPTAHLDFRNELNFLERLAYMVSELDVAILMATHSPNQAFYFEDRGIDTKVTSIKDGKIHSAGSVDEVITPKTIAEVYGIHASIAESEIDGKMKKQIIPIRTLEGKKNED